jgi:hypothetical protein
MTVEEVLRQSGFTDEQIKALDPKAITAFTGVLTTAETERQTAEKERQDAQAAREAAELAQRSNVDWYESKIAPAITAWDEEKQRYDNERAKATAEAAFYRTQAEEAKKSGFIPTEAPGFDASKFVMPPAPNPNQPRDAQGRYVPGVPGATPGSPSFFDVNKVYERAGDAVSILTDIQWEHQKLFGVPLPISPSELVRQADAMKLDPKAYASRTYGWDARRQQMQQEEDKKKADKIAADAVAPYELKLKEKDEQLKKELAEKDRQWAERVGSNPDVRIPQASRYADISRAVKANELPDPLTLNEQQRRQLTSTMIRKDITESQVA